MGTNYEIKIKKQDVMEILSLDDPYDYYHLGKSSGGWVFSLKIYPLDGIHNWDDWLKIFETRVVHIWDEYDRPVSVEDFITTVTDRSWGRNNIGNAQDFKEYCHRNRCLPGPNGLMRHIIDGRHCTGHGGGTYDYMIGEFS